MSDEAWDDLGTDERLAMVAALKEQYLDRTNGTRGTPCISATCLNLATTRVFWPVLPGEAFPVYCDACAAWAIKVLETLGHRVHTEALPTVVRPEDKRGIKLQGDV